MWIMYGTPIPIASADTVAVTGPNARPNTGMRPNAHSMTSATGKIVIRPRNGLRDSTRKLMTSNDAAASTVMTSDDS